MDECFAMASNKRIYKILLCFFFLLRKREGDGAARKARKARKAEVRESTARLIGEKVVEKRYGRGGDR
jgi:hypothetical protein